MSIPVAVPPPVGGVPIQPVWPIVYPSQLIDGGVGTTMATLPVPPGLSDDEETAYRALIAEWNSHRTRNLLRSSYYDGRHAVRDLGISTPPALRHLPLVLGWSAKAVDVLNRRCNIEGFVLPGTDLDETGLTDVWIDNRLDVEAPQVGVSSLIHGPAFLVTTQGDADRGEPPVVITGRSALHGAGLWDGRRRALRAFLSILETDTAGWPSAFVMYLPDLNVACERDADGAWQIRRREHIYGVPVEAVVYKPRLGRPFGSSRISRAVMSLHDQALRTVLRSEVQAELYSAPQRVLLGADESIFRDQNGNVIPKWQAILGRIWAIPDDEDATQPRADIKEFAAANQEPHMAQLRAQAQLFAGETSIPISSLGISSEGNPTSAEAYVASREDLIAEAEGTTEGWSPAWVRTGQNALRMLNGTAELPAEFDRLQVLWRSPLFTSRAAAADAGQKTIAAVPWLAETEVGLELLGLSRTQIERATAERDRAAARASLAGILGGEA